MWLAGSHTFPERRGLLKAGAVTGDTNRLLLLPMRALIKTPAEGGRFQTVIRQPVSGDLHRDGVGGVGDQVAFAKINHARLEVEQFG